MSTAAISTSFGEVMDKLYTQDIFNISAVQIFIRETPLTEQNLIKSRLIQFWLSNGQIVYTGYI